MTFRPRKHQAHLVDRDEEYEADLAADPEAAAWLEGFDRGYVDGAGAATATPYAQRTDATRRAAQVSDIGEVFPGAPAPGRDALLALLSTPEGWAQIESRYASTLEDLLEWCRGHAPQHVARLQRILRRRYRRQARRKAAEGVG